VEIQIFRPEIQGNQYFSENYYGVKAIGGGLKDFLFSPRKLGK